MATALKRFTKEEYLAWLAARGESGTWKHDDCIRADRHIEHEALTALEGHLKSLPKPLAEFVRVCASAHFGSVETDTMLTQLKCYPEWMEKREG